MAQKVSIPCMDTESLITSGILNLWYRQINNYNSRSLTKASDRFPAIGGLASEFSIRTGFEYKAGLWKHGFHRGLLWARDPGSSSVDWTHSPSWSWAARVKSTEHRDPYCPNMGYWKQLPGPEATWINDSVEYGGGGIFGHVLSAALSLQGLCICLNILWEQIPCIIEPRQLDDSKENAGKARLFVDVEIESLHMHWNREGLLVLYLARFENFGTDDWGGPLSDTWFRGVSYEGAAFGIVLERVDALSKEYRRIGILNMPLEASVESGWEMKTVTII